MVQAILVLLVGWTFCPEIFLNYFLHLWQVRLTKKSVLFEELFALTGKRGGRDRVRDTGRSAQL